MVQILGSLKRPIIDMKDPSNVLSFQLSVKIDTRIQSQFENNQDLNFYVSKDCKKVHQKCYVVISGWWDNKWFLFSTLHFFLYLSNFSK